MSWEVSHAYWHHWQPGHNLTQDSTGQFDIYIKKASRYNSPHRMLLLALAMDATPIKDVFGLSEMALAYTSIEALMTRMQRSRRSIQYLLRELDYWGELQVQACDGHCAVAKFAHHGTNHYYLPLPEGAQPWGRNERRQGRRRKAKKAE